MDQNPLKDQKTIEEKQADIVQTIAATMTKTVDVKTIEQSDIPDLVRQLMQIMGKDYSSLDGKAKKAIVIAVLQLLCPDPTIDKIIPGFIDLIVEVDKDKIRINQRISSWCSCFSSKKQKVQ